MRITKLELVSNGEHIGSTPIREQAVNAAKAHANRHGVEVEVIATMEDGSTRKITVKPDGSVDRVWQREYMPTSITSLSSRTAPSRRRASWQTSKRSWRRMRR